MTPTCANGHGHMAWNPYVDRYYCTACPYTISGNQHHRNQRAARGTQLALFLRP